MSGASRRHAECHPTRAWLRAADLGANHGIVFTARPIAGLVAAKAAHASVPITGLAGLVAGSMSMTAGECVAVDAQPLK